MKTRHMPYGYEVQNGKYTINAEEASAVREVFRFYRAGHSYGKISAAMNESGCPPYGAGGWNKHHIKRMLENERYLGAGGYPAIISSEEYTAVRKARDEKMIGNSTTDKSAEALWKRLKCGDCGHRLLRIRARQKDIIRLRCENSACGTNLKLHKADLYAAAAELLTHAVNSDAAALRYDYKPAPEILRLESQISRVLAKPDDPAEAARMIMQGIDARYACVQASRDLTPIKYSDDKSHAIEPDWESFKKTVSCISMSRTGIGLKTITGQEIFMERTDGAHGQTI